MSDPSPIPILMYHSIAAMPKGTVMRSLHVPPKRFRLQMQILKWLGYKGLSMSGLLPYLKGDRSGKVVGITFDDGYRNNLTEALPILHHLGFSATCYIISQKIGGINEWDLENGISENPLMNDNEVRQWIEGGMEIGSHTCNHIPLTECTLKKSTIEITKSRQDLEKQFNCDINHFCYPWGKYNSDTVRLAREAGYQSATTVARGRFINQHSLWELPRVPVTHSTYPYQFLTKLLTPYEENHE